MDEYTFYAVLNLSQKSEHVSLPGRSAATASKGLASGLLLHNCSSGSLPLDEHFAHIWPCWGLGFRVSWWVSLGTRSDEHAHQSAVLCELEGVFF